MPAPSHPSKSAHPTRLSRPILLAALLTTLLYAHPTYADFLYAWGNNDFGQLGDGTTTSRTIPAPVAAFPAGANAYTVGDSHNLVVLNGALFSCGNNLNGQLGDGTTVNRSLFVHVPTLASNVTAVAAGPRFSLALVNGGVFAWGENPQGQLGDGTFTPHILPTPVPSLSSGVTAIATGNTNQCLAIKNGGVYAWGQNLSGEVGDGSTTACSTPIALSELSSGVTAIATGAFSSLAIKNGALYQWGDGTKSPTLVPSMASNVTAIESGGRLRLAVKGGQVYAWGNGYPGDGNALNYSTPHLVPSLSNIVDVATGEEASFALASDGTLWSWGANDYGFLGFDDGQFLHLTPVHVLPPAGMKFTRIFANEFNVFATVAFVVPEPTSCVILALGLCASLTRRPRK